jgi:hypothetical protein
VGHHRNDSDVRSDLLAATPVQQRRAQLTLVEPGQGRAHDSGNAVVDFIFFIAKRDVTFLSGMAAMSLF